MTPDFPLGIADLLHPGERSLFSEGMTRVEAGHWYWCRRHQEAEHVNTPTKRDPDPTISCVRIGPFMSEREANRLGEVMTCTGDNTGAHHRNRPPLGMEVEL